jgi:predicted negative regulator of RcsB-dependent stress response
MALQLDLEEQEQVAKLRHFWNQYGNLISWVLVVVLGGYAAWTGWNFWQHRQAVQASAMFDEVTRVAEAGDAAKVERAFNDMKAQFSGHILTQQAGLLTAQVLSKLDKTEGAQAALGWVAEQNTDEGLQAIAKLRLAALLLDRKSHDQALQVLKSVQSKHFAGLAADRRGDILMDQGKPEEAKKEYVQAYKDMPKDADYRSLVEAKLNALGVDASVLEGKK